MKKILYLLIIGLLFLTGCTKTSVDSIFKDLTNKINNLSGYTLNGNLEVKNSNNTYNYQVEASYKSKDKFRVSLTNTSNNHEQVILRNDEGVYVLTPSLNKSFKFQSDWPYNNSQIYLLGSIIEDLNNDTNVLKEEVDDKYVFTSKVNYPNNSSLTKQRVTATKDLLIEKVEVLTDSDEVEMTFTVTNINYEPTFDESYFEVNSIINNSNNSDNNSGTDNNTLDNNSTIDKDKTDNTTDSNQNNMNTSEGTTTDEPKETEQTATLEDIIYPLYLPTGTVLEAQEKVSKTDGERVILTFSGEKSFTLVEETVLKAEEFTVIPTYGEPSLVNDTVGAMTDNSLNWISNGVEYYIVSDVMNSEELLNIARSINVTAVSSLK